MTKSNNAENAALHHRNKLHIKMLKYKMVLLYRNNITAFTVLLSMRIFIENL